MNRNNGTKFNLLDELMAKAGVCLTKPQLRKLGKQAMAAAEAAKRKPKRLTEADRHAIRKTNENPNLVMKKYGVKIGTIRQIKSGTGSYASSHANIEKWYAYKGRWARQIENLTQDEKANQVRRPSREKDPSNRILDVVTSSEPPRILMERLGYTMTTFRQIKSGTGYYKDYGGSMEAWNEYRALYEQEIVRLTRESR